MPTWSDSYPDLPPEVETFQRAWWVGACEILSKCAHGTVRVVPVFGSELQRLLLGKGFVLGRRHDLVLKQF